MMTQKYPAVCELSAVNWRLMVPSWPRGVSVTLLKPGSGNWLEEIKRSAGLAVTWTGVGTGVGVGVGVRVGVGVGVGVKAGLGVDVNVAVGADV